MSRRWPVNGLVLAVLWLFVRGVPLTPTRVLEEFLIGLLVGMPVAYAARRLYAPETPVQRTLRTVPYVLLYLAVFLRDLVTANLSVAKVVLLPSMPISPAVVEVPLRVRTDAAITTIANSITLTPGTLTMDYDRDANTLYVHCIDVDEDDVEAVVDPVRTWEDYALVIFDEELKPGDPVPAPTYEDVEETPFDEALGEDEGEEPGESDGDAEGDTHTADSATEEGDDR